MLSKFINLFKFVWYHPLNDNSRLAAIWRVISWQFSKKFETYKYNPLKQQLISLNGKFSSADNTLYLRKLNEVKQRISKKSICILGSGKKI
jgi:hypothetical protein